MHSIKISYKKKWHMIEINYKIQEFIKKNITGKFDDVYVLWVNHLALAKFNE